MEIRLPKLGEGADSGTVASIFVKIGDRLAKDQAILELESEKAVASIPSPAEGVVSAIHVKEGDVVKVGQLLVSLGEGSGATSGDKSAGRPIDARVGDERAGTGGRYRSQTPVAARYRCGGRRCSHTRTGKRPRSSSLAYGPEDCTGPGH